MSEVKNQLVEEESALSNARSPLSSFELPNGWLDFENLDSENRPKIYKEVHLREITGEEEDLLAASKLSAHQRMNGVMSGCLEKIGDIEDKQKIKKIVNELTSVDRFFLIYKIREISLGKIYIFSSPCPSCSDNSDRAVDLSEINFPSLPDPYKRAFEGVLPKSGFSYRWLVQTGRIEERADKVLKAAGNKILSAMIAQRLEMLNDKPVSIQDVAKLTAADRNFLRNEFRTEEGTVDDVITVECRSCGYEFNVEANISRAEFFFPTQ